MHNLLQVSDVQLPVLVCIQLRKLSPQELLIFGDGDIEEAGDELGVVDLSTIVEVHGEKDLVDVFLFEVGVDVLLEVVESYCHLFPRNHAVAVVVELDEYLTQVFYFLLRNLHCQVHQYRLF